MNSDPLNLISLRHCLKRHFPQLQADLWQITPLSGLTGESYLLFQAGLTLVGRHHNRNNQGLGVSRQKEWRILNRFKQTQLAPQVIATTPNWLILSWVEGEILTPELYVNPTNVIKLADTISQLHNHSSTGYRLQLKAQFAAQWQQIDKKRLSPRWLVLQRNFIRKPLPTPLKLAPAHMDIHVGNVLLTSSGLKLIDWEYAADVDIGLSLATFFKANNWDLTLKQLFLRYYKGYQKHQDIMTQIDKWSSWVDYMMLMWYETRWAQSADENYLVAADPLRQRLNLTSS